MSTVEDILMVKGPDVIVGSPTDTAYEAARLMAQANVGAVVVKDGLSPVGIFTERDLLRRVVAAGRDSRSTLLAEVMSCPPRTCRLGDDARTCAELMRCQHIRHLIVVEEGAVVGMVSLRDVLSARLEDLQAKVRQD